MTERGEEEDGEDVVGVTCVACYEISEPLEYYRKKKTKASSIPLIFPSLIVLTHNYVGPIKYAMAIFIASSQANGQVNQTPAEQNQ